MHVSFPVISIYIVSVGSLNPVNPTIKNENYFGACIYIQNAANNHFQGSTFTALVLDYLYIAMLLFSP